MILRSFTLAGGILGAAATSQFPEFSQQYTQRLGGAVDALKTVVADFDASAQAAGLSRGEALAELQGTPFLEARKADMTRTFARYETLQADLTALEGKGPFMRAYHATRLRDGQIARAAWTVFQPALPLNFAGLVFAGLGFVSSAMVLGLLFRLLRLPFAQRKTLRRSEPQT